MASSSYPPLARFVAMNICARVAIIERAQQEGVVAHWEARSLPFHAPPRPRSVVFRNVLIGVGTFMGGLGGLLVGIAAWATAHLPPF